MLKFGTDQGTISENIATEILRGHPPAQAAAIAYRFARSQGPVPEPHHVTERLIEQARAVSHARGSARR